MPANNDAGDFILKNDSLHCDYSPWALIFRYGLQYPERTAIIFPGMQPLTYADLCTTIHVGVQALRERTIGQENRVAVVLPNGPLLATTILSVSSIACCAPLSPQLTAEEYRFELADLRCSALITTDNRDNPAREVAEELGIDIITAGLPGEIYPGTNQPFDEITDGDEWEFFPGNQGNCLVMHTSGTTARPKIVPLTRKNLTYSAARISESLLLKQDDRCLNVMPLFHVHGLIGCLFSSLMAGGSVICSPGFSSEDFFSWIHELSPTWYSAVPTIHEAVYRRGIGLNYNGGHRLRFIRSCSSPLPPSLAEKLERLFSIPVIEAYGMSEATHQISVNPLPPGIRKSGSVGLPAGCEVAILFRGNRILPAGKTGEIAIKGQNVITGYERNPDANESSFTAGWLRTGDQGYLDNEGYLYITGRIKEIINKGGEKVSPREIDEIFMGHPDVLSAVSFAFPHPKLGEDIALAIVPAPGKKITVSQLRHYALQHLAPFKIPSKYFIVPEIPKGPTGKIKRTALPALFNLAREQISENLVRSKDRTISVPRNSQDAMLVKIWEEVLGISPVGIDDDFFMLGGTSLAAVEMVSGILGETKTSLPPTILYRAPTIRDLSDLMDAGVQEARYLLPLQPRGSFPPLFLVPPSDGSAFFYTPLAEFLGPEQPVYSFTWPGIDGREPAPGSIGEIADRFLEDIITLQDGKPFILGGFCFGGLVALEMARRVLDGTTSPAVLLLLDPDVPMNGPGWTSPRSSRIQNLQGEARLYRERGLRFLGRVQLLRARRIIEKLRMDHIQRLYRRVQKGHVTASFGYISDYYPARVCVIMSEEYLENRMLPMLKKILTGPSEYHVINGSKHRELLVIGADEISGLISHEVTRVVGKNGITVKTGETEL